MKKNEKYFVVVICVIIAVLMYLMVDTQYDYIKEEQFNSEFEPGTDSYMEDSLTYMHPDWSYERIQEELYVKPVEE